MKRIVNIFWVLLIVLGMLTTTVKAASFKFTATPSKTEVEAGETITISLKLSDINAGELGINTFKCVFKYDETIFENVQVTSANNWSITFNDQSDNSKSGTLLAVLLSAGVTEDQEIGQITLKIKSDSKGKTGNITFTDVSTNDGQQTIYDTNKTISVKVKGEQVNTENENKIDSNTQVNVNTENNNASNTNTNSSSNTNTPSKDNTVSQGKLPQTGISNTIIFMCIILIALFSIIGYIKYKEYKKLK